MSDTTVIQLPDGLKFKIRSDTQSGDERYILERLVSGEEYTPKGFEIHESDTIIDIGAHIGRFALYAASLAPRGILYAFEPQPENMLKLKENIGLNGLQNIVVSANAIADSTKKILLHTGGDSARSSLYGESQESVAVDCIPLVEVFDKNSIAQCAFLKSDCEGAEFEIFFALPTRYFKKIDKIVLEFHDHLSAGKKMIDLLHLLTSEGYVLRARWGAFYTGLLFARRVSGWRARTGVLLLRNYFFVYGVDFSNLLLERLVARFLSPRGVM